MAGGGLALQQRGILRNQKNILQRAANRERATSFRESLRKAKGPEKVAAPKKDPLEALLHSKLHSDRHRIWDNGSTSQENYDKHFKAIMQHVHSPIEGGENLVPGAIDKIKQARISSKVADLRTARQDRVDEGFAWDRFHKQMTRELRDEGVTKIEKHSLPEKFKNYEYSKPHKAYVDRANLPELSETQQQRASRAGTAQQKQERSPIKVPGVKDRRGAPHVDSQRDDWKETHQKPVSLPDKPYKPYRIVNISPEKSTESVGHVAVEHVPEGGSQTIRPDQMLMAKEKAVRPKIRANLARPPKVAKGPMLTPYAEKLIAKNKKKALSRIMKLIEFDVTLNESRDSGGKFSSGGGPMTDPSSMQYAYHMPLVNPSSPSNLSPFSGNGQQARKRGRGRPPGSLNQSTLAMQQAQQVHQEAVAAQPESKNHPLLKAGLVAAGVAATGGLVAGPAIYRGLKTKAFEEEAVRRILPRVQRGENQPFAEDILASGKSIEQGIIDRATNIKNLHKERVAKNPSADRNRLTKASAWMKENPDAKLQDNPFFGITSKKTGTAAKMEDREYIIKTREQMAKTGERSARTQSENDALTRDLKKQKEIHKALIEQHGAASQQVVDQGKHIDELNKQLGSAIQPLSSNDKVKAALATLKQGGGEDATAEEVSALRRHNRIHGRDLPAVQVRPGKQGDLFDVLNIASPGKIGQGPVPYDQALEHVEALKNKMLATRGDEIAAIAKQHGHNPEDVAHAMALRQATGKTARIVPSIPQPNPNDPNYAQSVAAHEKVVAARNEDVLARDKMTKGHGETVIRTAGQKAREDYLREIGQTQLKTPEQRAEAARRIAEAEKKAARAYSTQAASEGRIPRSSLIGLPYGSKSVRAQDLLGLSRRIHHRITMDKIIHRMNYFDVRPVKSRKAQLTTAARALLRKKKVGHFKAFKDSGPRPTVAGDEKHTKKASPYLMERGALTSRL